MVLLQGVPPRSPSKRSLSRMLARWFPTPRILNPRSAGVDISDSSIKWIVLEQEATHIRVAGYGYEPLAQGTIVDGVIHNEEELAKSLAHVSHLAKITHAHASLPEEGAYVFSMHVPEKTNREQILSMIEFELEARVPIPPAEAVYDFSTIMEHDDGLGAEIGVMVFPRELALSYTRAFEAAGMTALSLEVEARSMARAISQTGPNEPLTLAVDFGRARTGFAVLKRGIPIFTSTVEVGGDAMTKVTVEKKGISAAEAQVFNDEQGLLGPGGQKDPAVAELTTIASALAEEIAKHYHYWDTRRNDKGERMTPVGRVLLVGGSANLRGLTDYIAGRVKATTERPNVWQNVCSFEHYIPPIDRHESLQYVTAIGLALRGI